MKFPSRLTLVALTFAALSVAPVALVGSSTVASAASLGAGQPPLKPCPGPYYVSPPIGTAIVFGVRRDHLSKITKGQCEPPPTGAYNAPKLCGTQFVGYGTPFSLMTCSHVPIPICGTAAADTLVITGYGLFLQVPGRRIFKVDQATGTFVPVSAILHRGGEYAIVPPGQSPKYEKAFGNCVPIPPRIPLPPTGGATAPAMATVADSSLNSAVLTALGLLASAIAAALFAFRRRRLLPVRIRRIPEGNWDR